MGTSSTEIVREGSSAELLVVLLLSREPPRASRPDTMDSQGSCGEMESAAYDSEGMASCTRMSVESQYGF